MAAIDDPTIDDASTMVDGEGSGHTRAGRQSKLTMKERVMARLAQGRPSSDIVKDARRRAPLVGLSLAALVLVVAACGSSASPPAGTSAGTSVGLPPVSTAAVAALPPGYALHKGPGFSIGLSSDWQTETPGNGIALRATNTLGGRNWLLLLAWEADEKPASQSFDDYAATQRARCDPGTVPDTLVAPAGSVYVCHAASSSLGLDVLDYRLPVGGNVWHLTLSFQDAVYSGAGQEEAETILRTLVLTP